MAEHARETELFADELVSTILAPFALRVRGDEHPGHTGRLATRAMTLLRGAAMLDSEHTATVTSEEDEPAWWRLEAKLDLVLEMMGALHRRNGSAPAIDLRCSRLGVAGSLPGAVLTPPGPATASIELHALIPQPMEWPGDLVLDAPEHGVTPFWFRFEPMPEALQSAWERHLFRHHRRTIATARRRA